jgi:predicted dehydrogenase
MSKKLDRRMFLGAAGAAMTATATAAKALDEPGVKPVRLGVIGVGNRGKNLLQIALGIGNVEIAALCDIDKERVAAGQDLVASSGRKKPEGYTGAEDYKKLTARDDVDAVLIATPWKLHTPMGVNAMQAGKYTGIEVPAAQNIEQCWELVNTQEATRTPCMMLENWSFRRDNLAVLKMIRAGLLGEINHCHCAHSHDCIEEWWFKEDGTPRWGGEYLLTRNADQYPTHSLGPVLSWLDLNNGDYPAYLTSTATRSLSIRAHYTKKFGPNHAAATRQYKQADIVTSVIKTIKGNTIVVNYDMQSPRPYDNRWEISGTNGLYNEQRESVYIAGRSPKPEQWESFAPYQKEFDHSWYKRLDAMGTDRVKKELAHGGPDYIEIMLFLEACREKKPLPIDIYDSVLMSAPIELSEKSIANGSAPVPFPDFTRGQWKTRKPYFALDV